MPPRREYHFWVYIMASRSLQLYIGMTNNLRRRIAEHKAHLPGSYTARYNIDRLVYFEQFQYVGNAIARETKLKDWNRARKLALIAAENPTWIDFAEAWRDAGSFAAEGQGRAASGVKGITDRSRDESGSGQEWSRPVLTVDESREARDLITTSEALVSFAQPA